MAFDIANAFKKENRKDLTWNNVVRNHLKVNHSSSEKNLQELSCYRDVIDCVFYKETAEMLFPKEFFSVIPQSERYVTKQPDGNYLPDMRYYVLRVYTTPFKGYNIAPNTPFFEIVVQAPGSRSLTSDIDTTLRVSGAEKVGLDVNKTHFYEKMIMTEELRGNELTKEGLLKKCDANELIKALMIRGFNDASEREYGMTSALHRDSNVYSDGFLGEDGYPRYKNIFATYESLFHEKLPVMPKEKHLHELAASLFSLRQALSKKEWGEFTQRAEVIKSGNQAEIRKIIGIADGLYCYFENALNQQKQTIKHRRKLENFTSPLQGADLEKDAEVAAFYELYVQHLEQLSVIKGEIKANDIEIGVLCKQIASLEEQLRGINEEKEYFQHQLSDIQVPPGVKQSLEPLLEKNKQKNADTNEPYQKALVRIKFLLVQQYVLFEKQIKCQVHANLFAYEGYVNRSAPYHVVKGIQSKQPIKITGRIAVCSALQQIGFKLLHTKLLTDEKRGNESHYKTAKYGFRVAHLLFGETKQEFSEKMIADIHANKKGTPDIFASLFLKPVDPLNEIFTEQEYHVINLDLAIIHNIKDKGKAEIAEREKNDKAQEFFAKKYPRTGDAMKEWLNIALKFLEIEYRLRGEKELLKRKENDSMVVDEYHEGGDTNNSKECRPKHSDGKGNSTGNYPFWNKNEEKEPNKKRRKMEEGKEGQVPNFSEEEGEIEDTTININSDVGTANLRNMRHKKYELNIGGNSKH